MHVSAILWDYDGTLVDSTKKNIEVTKEVLKNFIPDIYNNIPEALTSVELYQEANYKYKNWRELYKVSYGLTDTQVDEAGKLWSPYQLANPMTPDMFEGISESIKKLGSIRHGICSQNCSNNIENTLKKYEVAQYFKAIIGYEDISFKEQKPNPVGFLKCIELLGVPVKDSTFIYIGDHQEDVVFGKNAEAYFNEQGYNTKVICIAAAYSGSNPTEWSVKPDFIAREGKQIVEIITNI